MPWLWIHQRRNENRDFRSIRRRAVAVLIAAACLPLATKVAVAQSSSLMSVEGAPAPTLSRFSWTYQPPQQPRTLRLHDLITVLVDEKTQVIAEGNMDRRKKADGKFVLSDWILLKGWSLVPDPQSNGDPTIAAQMENKYRAQSELSTREAMKLRVACEVVDIRPNGTLVIEGRRAILVNNESWEIYVTGTIDPQTILPDNTVLSENVANLRVVKREGGHVRDGYRRGWLLKWMDEHQPF
ncbi:flagellar basal body L-ring protein FlgH [Thermopirellula anaerolimosa]